MEFSLWRILGTCLDLAGLVIFGSSVSYRLPDGLIIYSFFKKMLNWAKKVGLLCDNRNVKTTEQMYQRGDRTEMFAPITLAIEAQAKLTATPPDIDDWMFMLQAPIDSPIRLH